MPWRILVVDDEADVHAVTRLILAKIIFKQRPIELLTAYSALQAQQVLQTEKNISVILLDVVMLITDGGWFLLIQVHAVRTSTGELKFVSAAEDSDTDDIARYMIRCYKPC